MQKLPKKAYNKQSETYESLIRDIHEVCMMIECVGSRFELQSDYDLIDECIYQMEALRARYRYLLRLAKESGVHYPQKSNLKYVVDN